MTNGSPKEFSDVVEAGKVLLWLLCTFTSKNKNMGMLTNLLIFSFIFKYSRKLPVLIEMDSAPTTSNLYMTIC